MLQLKNDTILNKFSTMMMMMIIMIIIMIMMMMRSTTHTHLYYIITCLHLNIGDLESVRDIVQKVRQIFTVLVTVLCQCSNLLPV